jgi:hypothetical protein
MLSLFVEVQEFFQAITWGPVTAIIGILYLLLFFSILYFLLVMAPLVIYSKEWPQVTGKIIKNELKRRDAEGSIEGTRTTHYSAELEYLYPIKGKEFSSKKIKLFKNDIISRKFNQGILDKYPKGASVKVFYNPKKPSFAILETGGGARLLVIITLLILGFGAMTAFLMDNLVQIKIR